MIPTPFEANRGESWTTREEEADFLEALSEYPNCEIRSLGTSVLGNPVNAIIVGAPLSAHTDTCLLVSSQHGDEPAPRDAALTFARDLVESEDSSVLEYLESVTWVIVPAANPDRILDRRTNENAVDLNRDWADLSQPETRSIESVLRNFNPVLCIDSHEGGISFDEDLTATNRKHLETDHPSMFAASQMMFYAVKDAIISRGGTFDRYGSWPTSGPSDLLQSRVPLYGAAPILLESYQNSSNDINVEVPPTREFHLRVGDNVSAYHAVLEAHASDPETFRNERLEAAPPPGALRPEAFETNHVFRHSGGKFIPEFLRASQADAAQETPQ